MPEKPSISVLQRHAFEKGLTAKIFDNQCELHVIRMQILEMTVEDDSTVVAHGERVHLRATSRLDQSCGLLCTAEILRPRQ